MSIESANIAESVKTLKPEGYLPRVVDEQLNRYLKLFGAIEICGPKWCGKTWTGLSVCKDKVYIADPRNNYATKRLAQIDPHAVLQGDHPLLIDEWQEASGLWDAVRESVDAGTLPGAYVLTGSTRPQKEAPAHTGTGRIARIDMHPMTLYETGDSTAEVSLSALFNEPEHPIKGRADHSLDDIINLAIRGGWPSSAGLSAEDGSAIAQEYVRSIIAGKDIEAAGHRFSPSNLEAFLRSFARNTSTVAGDETVRRDTGSGSAKEISRTAFASYLDYLKRIYMIWEQPAWRPQLRSATRLRTSPKRHLADPSLAVACLKARMRKFKQDLNTFGFVFETMVARDLLVYTQNLGGNLYFYRDNSGLEVDAIIECDSGYAAIEIKLGAEQEDSAAANLLRFKKKMMTGQEDEPVLMAIIEGTAQFAHIRSDGIHVIPIGCLAP